MGAPEDYYTTFMKTQAANNERQEALSRNSSAPAPTSPEPEAQPPRPAPSPEPKIMSDIGAVPLMPARTIAFGFDSNGGARPLRPDGSIEPASPLEGIGTAKMPRYLSGADRVRRESAPISETRQLSLPDDTQLASRLQHPGILSKALERARRADVSAAIASLGSNYVLAELAVVESWHNTADIASGTEIAPIDLTKPQQDVPVAVAATAAPRGPLVIKAAKLSSRPPTTGSELVEMSDTPQALGRAERFWQKRNEPYVDTPRTDHYSAQLGQTIHDETLKLLGSDVPPVIARSVLGPVFTTGALTSAVAYYDRSLQRRSEPRGLQRLTAPHEPDRFRHGVNQDAAKFATRAPYEGEKAVLVPDVKDVEVQACRPLGLTPRPSYVDGKAVMVVRGEDLVVALEDTVQPDLLARREKTAEVLRADGTVIKTYEMALVVQDSESGIVPPPHYGIGLKPIAGQTAGGEPFVDIEVSAVLTTPHVHSRLMTAMYQPPSSELMAPMDTPFRDDVIEDLRETHRLLSAPSVIGQVVVQSFNSDVRQITSKSTELDIDDSVVTDTNAAASDSLSSLDAATDS